MRFSQPTIPSDENEGETARGPIGRCPERRTACERNGVFARPRLVLG
jgi:hypothetical protein